MTQFRLPLIRFTMLQLMLVMVGFAISAVIIGQLMQRDRNRALRRIRIPDGNGLVVEKAEP
jgi:hypothetical protein